jgi:HD superfamily phosphodiesterase
VSLIDEIRALAEPYWQTRANEIHVPESFELARRLLEAHPQADEGIVLPAILLHDCGYFLVPEEDHLKGLAGAPIGWEADITRRHEIEGARLAGEILERVGYDPQRTLRIQEIIDGHDSRSEALSLEDALVKDADKAWRFTPSGVRVCHAWMGRTPEAFMDYVESRIDDWFLTQAGRDLARSLLQESRCASW